MKKKLDFLHIPWKDTKFPTRKHQTDPPFHPLTPLPRCSRFEKKVKGEHWKKTSDVFLYYL